jgi:hypothetical protein
MSNKSFNLRTLHSPNLRQILLCLGLWLIITSLSLFVAPKNVSAVFPLQKLEQQITIMNGEFSTMNQTDSPTDNSLGLIHFDGNNYVGATVYFEAVIKCDTCSGGNHQASASLYSSGGSSQISVTSTSGTYIRVRSGTVSLSTGDYTVRFKVDGTAGIAYIKAARLIITQNYGVLTKTETQVEMGSYESTANAGSTALAAPKYYQYNHDLFTPSPTAYFEATIKTSAVTNNATYYFNNYDTGNAWSTNPANMVDSNTGTYASTNTDTQVEKLTSNTNSGTNLGTITKVEIRVHGFQDNDTNGYVTLTPVFSGLSNGSGHNFNLPKDTGDWSGYTDITTDPNAPSTWSWADVQNLNLDIAWNVNGTSNTASVSRIDIRVTYDTYGTAYAELYNRTNSTVVATVSNNTTNYTLVRSAALTTNWDTVNDDEYEVRIYSSSNSYTTSISNAKIILNQTDLTNGISDVELVWDMITTTRTETNSSYTISNYLNYFEPNYFLSSRLRYYFETTIKTSSGNGNAMLYDDSNTDPINTPINSEVTTSSTSFSLLRSGNLARNDDWPGSAVNFDTILKNPSVATTTVSSSRLIIQTGYVDPSLTVTIEGVDSGETHNGVTTNITTTSTSIPFGHIAVGTAIYGAHKFTVNLNEAATAGYMVYMQLGSPFQGDYPANNIDGFTGNSASWTSPQTWESPTGTAANVDTGWFGANITNSKVSGWTGGNTSGKFGPVTTDPIPIMKGASDTTDVDYISYALEVNQLQPADTYATTILYSVVPVY